MKIGLIMQKMNKKTFNAERSASGITASAQ